MWSSFRHWQRAAVRKWQQRGDLLAVVLPTALLEHALLATVA